jgi:hypothetical protein
MTVRLALDYDLTYTLDPEFWDGVIEWATDRGHEVRIVTARSATLDNIDEKFDNGLFSVPIIYCDGVAKRFHCTWFADDGAGWLPDVWIDDKPQAVDNNSTATREELEIWRKGPTH